MTSVTSISCVHLGLSAPSSLAPQAPALPLYGDNCHLNPLAFRPHLRRRHRRWLFYRKVISVTLIPWPLGPIFAEAALLPYGGLCHLDPLAFRPHLRQRCWRGLFYSTVISVTSASWLYGPCSPAPLALALLLYFDLCHLDLWPFGPIFAGTGSGNLR